MSVKTTEMPLEAVGCFPAEICRCTFPWEAHQMGQDCTSKRGSGQECVSKKSLLWIPTKKGEVTIGRGPQLLTQTIVYAGFMVGLCYWVSWFSLDGGRFRRNSSNFFVYKDVPFCVPRSALVMKANMSQQVKLNLFSQLSLGSETTSVWIFFSLSPMGFI